MRKSVYFLICFLMVIVLSACKQSDTPNTQDGGGADFVLGTDNQPDCGFGIVYTEKGIYSSQGIVGIGENPDGWILNYSEYGSDVITPVCSKADCNHENSDCNAFFEQDIYPQIVPNYLWYYNGNLYVFCVHKDYYAIEKIEKDGSSRSESCVLFRTNVETETSDDGVKMTDMYYPEVMLHRGYAYFSTYYPGCKKCSLYRVKLDSSKKSELLCTQDGNYPIIYRLKGYGDSVFYEKGNFADEEGKEVALH